MTYRRVNAQARAGIDRHGPTFSIVTPVLNSGHFLDETIMSIVSQAGAFSIRYHVQDAGSTDGAIERLDRWSKVLATGFPVLCGGVDFSYSVEADRGLYDGVSRGFAACGSSDYMSWLNADDRFEPGAFQTITELFGKFDDVHWVGGRPLIISEAGVQGQLVPRRAFARPAIEAGVYDGRSHPFLLQQEGMFWRSSLYGAVGGIDADYRLAGDFDLWRRFAERADLVIVDALIAAFRIREGQLSSGANYHNELDERLDPGVVSRRDKLAEIMKNDPPIAVQREHELYWRVAVHHASGEGWRLHPHLLSQE